MKSTLSNVSDFFRLTLFGQRSLPIYTNYHAAQIKAAIEYPALIGNVSVWFPNYASDNISTACSTSVNQSHGGFFLRFETNLGDIPLMGYWTNGHDISVKESTKGVNVSGRSLGHTHFSILTCCILSRITWSAADLPWASATIRQVLNLIYALRDIHRTYTSNLLLISFNSGDCICNKRQWSSDGTDRPGGIGDCSYFSGLPRSDDEYLLFGADSYED